MRRHITALLLMAALAPGVAMADPSVSPSARVKCFHKVASTNDWKLLEGAAINTTQSFTLVTGACQALQDRGTDEYRLCDGYAKLRVVLAYTYSAATNVTVGFSCSLDGTTYGKVTTRSCVSGTCKVFQGTDNNDVSGAGDDEDASAGNETFQLEYDILGCQKVKFDVDGTGADASDTVDAYACATTE